MSTVPALSVGLPALSLGLPALSLGLPALFLGLPALFLGLVVVVANALGVLTRASRPEERIRRRLAVYTVADRPAEPGATATATEDAGLLGRSAVARSAIGLADRVVERRGLEEVISRQLEAAGLPVRTGEWFLLHITAGVGGGLLMLLLSGAALAATVLGLLIGLAVPQVVLSVRQARRRSAFLAQLPDTLQLLAGSLKAGYSLPQAMDAAARQGDPPIATELNRALVETRLGMPSEDALERIGERMASPDFSWVVMAIRIQREVGGNLAALLITVAETLRERERLRRQVQVLSAEGRLSGIILGLLPVGFTAYLLVARPSYLHPLLSPIGVLMLVAAVVLMVVGTIWTAKVVRVEV